MEPDSFQAITATASSVCLTSPELPSDMLDANEFGFSPFQNWLLHVSKETKNPFQHRNLKLLLRRPLTDDQLCDGLRMLVEAHPMLRARFSCLADGRAKQYILEEAENSFSIRIHNITESDADHSVHIRHAQDELDGGIGANFGAELFRIHADSRKINILSLKAHPLVVDLYSWNIILQDLDDWFQHGKRPLYEGTSFPSWLNTLTTQARFIDYKSLPTPLSTVACSSATFEFWGIDDAANSQLHGIRDYSFVLDPTINAKLLAWPKNGASITDALLGALLFSFSEVFGQKHTPSVFVEEQGRDSLCAGMDLSHTVGCFGAFSPVVIQPLCPDITEAICRVHKARAVVQNKGISYFATRLIDPAHRMAFYQKHTPMEILFTYHGPFHSTERSGTLFKSYEPGESQSRTAGIPRSSLIDVCVSDEGGSLKVLFEYNQKLRRQQHLFKWFGRFKSACVLLANQTFPGPSKPEKVVSLTRLGSAMVPRNPYFESIRLGLRNVGLELADNELEDAYPCPPVQQGMLVSMLNQRASIYDMHLLFRFNSAPEEKLASRAQLEAAWHKIIHRHTMLRTVFAEFSGDKTSSPFCMGVLRKVNTSDVLKFKTCADENQVVLDYQNEIQKPSKNALSPQPLACLTIYQVSSCPRALYGYLRKNHLMMDAVSSMNIITELLQGYVGKLDEDVVPYADYVKYIERQIRTPSMDRFWNRYLEGLIPCRFPALAPLRERKAPAMAKTTELIPLCDTHTIQNFCRKNRLTVSNIAYAAWSLTLSRYTNQEEVCFGYPVSGRALPVRNIEKIIGPR